MQAVSKALNGLQCVKVDRSTKWGNPHSVHIHGRIAAVASFRQTVRHAIKAGDLNIEELRGKNLACWCKITDEHGKRVPCHADVLLELANK